MTLTLFWWFSATGGCTLINVGYFPLVGEDHIHAKKVDILFWYRLSPKYPEVKITFVPSPTISKLHLKMNNKLGITKSVVGNKPFIPFSDEECTYFGLALWTIHKCFQYMEAGVPYISIRSFAPELNFFFNLGGVIQLIE